MIPSDPRAPALRLQVVESAALHSCPGGGEGSGGGVRASEADDLVARTHEVRNDGRADKSGRAGDKFTHEA